MGDGTAVRLSDFAGEVVLIEGAGHYPQAEYPDQVVDAIASFVEGLGQM